MLTLKSTPNLSGVEISGDYDDLNAPYTALNEVNMRMHSKDIVNFIMERYENIE